MSLDDDFDRLIERAAAGDSEALGELWRQHNPHLLRYLRSLSPGGYEDLASAVWLDVARILPTFSGTRSGFHSLLFTIARRRHVDLIRASYRRPEVVSSHVPDWGEPAPHHDAEELDEVLRRVRTLPPDQAEAVALRVIGQLDIDQIASLLRKSPGAVRVALHRGLKRLGEEAALARGVGSIGGA
ncbi:MAG: RNA polymerase sigma factor [Acidimicrobiia bacterium]|nr:RNA polymerase sigma factor [Acidimicrobiia bacterium]